jgi:hypothetical protein
MGGIGGAQLLGRLQAKTGKAVEGVAVPRITRAARKRSRAAADSTGGSSRPRLTTVRGGRGSGVAAGSSGIGSAAACASVSSGATASTGASASGTASGCPATPSARPGISICSPRAASRSAPFAATALALASGAGRAFTEEVTSAWTSSDSTSARPDTSPATTRAASGSDSG